MWQSRALSPCTGGQSSAVFRVNSCWMEVFSEDSVACDPIVGLLWIGFSSSFWKHNLHLGQGAVMDTKQLRLILDPTTHSPGCLTLQALWVSFVFTEFFSVVLGIQVLSKYSTTELHSRSYLVSLSKWK